MMMLLIPINNPIKRTNVRGKNMKSLLLILLVLSVNLQSAWAEEPLSGSVLDSLAEAQEKLLHAKGSYKTIKMQEDAIQNMRKATNLSLKAARLRAKAEKMQHKADVLVNKANLAALSRGLYVTNPLAPVMMQPPPSVAVQPSTSPVTPPVPGEPINISIPKQQEVSQNPEDNSELPMLNNF
jgi:hypothetical protein